MENTLLETARYLFQAMRPRQWTKNLIIFVPVVFAAKGNDLAALFSTALYAFLFCLASSAVYLVNDVLDREQDRLHPIKRLRPIASGKVSVTLAFVTAALLAGTALLGAFVMRPSLTLIIVMYLLLMILYGTVLKHLVLLDAMAVACGFVLRAIGGCLVAAVPQSGWLLLCTSFGALFLALEKRRHELATLVDSAQHHRTSLLRYSKPLLDRIESIVLPALLICYILYSFLSWHGQWMMITVPFVFYGLIRYQLLSDEGVLTGTPEEVLLKDRPIQATVVLWVLAAIGVLYGFIPESWRALIHWLDSLTMFHP
jgi:4-hydroxybenzoate polyprenyltransferase